MLGSAVKWTHYEHGEADVLANARQFLLKFESRLHSCPSYFFTIWYISHLTEVSDHLHCLLFINMFKLCIRTVQTTHSETFPLTNALNCK